MTPMSFSAASVTLRLVPATTGVHVVEPGRTSGEALARYDRLYETHVARVTAYVRSRVPENRAEDLVAETFVVAWRRIDDVPAPALPWLLVVARNQISQLHRAESRSTALTAEITRLHHLETAGNQDVASDVVERLTVLGAIAGLARADREAIALTTWDGLSTKDAALVAGCSPAAFRVRLHRARRRLVRALADQDGPPPPIGDFRLLTPRRTRPVLPVHVEAGEDL